MRKTYLGLISILIILVLAYMLYGITQKVSEKERLEKGVLLPKFSFSGLDSTTFSDKDLEVGSAVIIKYFDPNCDHCQRETEELVQNISLLNGTPILMVTAADRSPVEDFVQNYSLADQSSITILFDGDYEFGQIFGDYSTPCTFVYDQDHRLIEFIRGEIETTYLQHLVEEAQ